MKDIMKDNKLILLFPVFFVLYEFTVYLANDMIMPGMIQVISDFSVPEYYVPASLTAFLIGGASLQIILGPLSDRFGRRKILLIGVFFFLCATLFILCSGSMTQFLYGRFFQGMGLCFIGVVGYASIQEMFEEKKAIKIISIMAIVALISPLAGPLLGGIYVQFFHWRGVFLLIGFLGLISLVGLYFFMPETVHLKLSPHHKPEKRPNLSQLPPLNMKNFIHNYLLILKNRKFLLGACALSLSNGPLLAWIAVSPVILMKKAGLSSVLYGLCQVPIFGALIVGNFLVHKIIARVRLQKVIYVGSAFCVFGLVLCGIIPLILGESYLNILIPISIYSFGIAVLSGTLNRLVLYSSPVAKGSVSAVFSLIMTCILALCTHAMVFVYKEQSNVSFGLFCLFTGVIFIPFILAFFNPRYQ